MRIPPPRGGTRQGCAEHAKLDSGCPLNPSALRSGCLLSWTGWSSQRRAETPEGADSPGPGPWWRERLLISSLSDPASPLDPGQHF